MTVKSLRKQLAAAIAMTLVATVALGSSTYAWFAINSKVEATGMSFTTQVSNNLFITTSEVTLDSTEILADSAFGTSLVATKSALLEPVSTVDGISYFWASTANVNGSGDTILDKWTAYNTDTEGKAAFNDNYGIKTPDQAEGYIDYIYNLKAINGSDDPLALRLTNIEMFSNVANDPQKAFRVAVFVNTATGSDDNTVAGTYSVSEALATNYKNLSDADVTKASIFTVNGAANFTSGQAVSAVDGTSAVEYNSPVEIKVAEHTTQFYKVVVRVWLEGEDTTCNNTTFADLNKGEWAMSTIWNLGAISGTGAATSASNITLGTSLAENPADPVSLTGSSVGTTAADFITINNVVYKPITGGNAPDDMYGAKVGDETRVYIMSENKLNPTDVTNMYKDIPSLD